MSIDALRAELDGLRALQRARITARQDRADAAARRAVGGGTALARSLLLVLVLTGYLTRHPPPGGAGRHLGGP